MSKTATRISFDEIRNSETRRKQIFGFKKLFKQTLPVQQPRLTLEEMFAAVLLSMKIDSIELQDGYEAEIDKISASEFMINISQGAVHYPSLSCSFRNEIITPGKISFKIFNVETIDTEDKLGSILIPIMDNFMSKI